jgi:hypothetical protein
MGPTGCPETSVTNHQSVLRNRPEEQTAHLHHGRSFKSHKYLSLAVRSLHFQVHFPLAIGNYKPNE